MTASVNAATEISPIAGFMIATIRLSTPLLIAATGELLTERAGVLNLGVEGIMLVGALCGFLGAYETGSVAIAWTAAGLAGATAAAVFCLFAVTLRAHQVIVALGINLAALGTTGFVYRKLFGLATTAPQIDAAPLVPLPWLSDLPVIGTVLFTHTLAVYAAFALVPLVWWLIDCTALGLTLRAVGENADAADAAGVRVQLVRYGATLVGGALAGFAGAYLSTVLLNVFLEGMTGGAGWIAVAIVIFGNWTPLGIMLAALTFGGAQALQLRLQSAGFPIPREFIIMLPYILTLVALAGIVRRSRAPAQLCIPFSRKS
jgi:general nucleoside transport system permease protein